MNQLTAADPETELRALWTAKGVSVERQNELIAEIKAKAQPGAMVGPFMLPFPYNPTSGEWS
jgi:hypothetical protein